MDNLKENTKGGLLWLITLLAVCLFTVMFIYKQAGAFDFWYWMSSNLLVVLTLVFVLDRTNAKEISEDISNGISRKILFGLLAAAGLFVVFYVGNILIRLIIDSAGDGISNVYSFKQDAAPLRIVVLMLLVIGPGEELFWRGYLQRRLGMRFGKLWGFILATALYTAVHLATGNMVLVLAALVCGIFWGWLYMRYKSMIINVVSHTVWDILVFIVLPFGEA